MTRASFLLGFSSPLLLTGAATDAAMVNVHAHGAKADGTTDDTAAFQRALDEAARTPGSTVHAPAGRYRIEGTVRVPASTTLRGDFVGPGGRSGTVLLVTGGRGRTTGPGCMALTGGRSTLIGFVFEYPDQSADAKEPVPYPFAITTGHSARIEEVFLFNAYQGIELDGAHAALVRNVWGEPLRVGIRVDHCYDIVRIENVHLWPYFTLGKPLRPWVQAHGVAFEFGRSDWQSVLNSFCYGYHTGYRFFRTGEVRPSPDVIYPAGVTNGTFVGIGADCVAIGMDVEDIFAIGVSVTNGAFAPFGASPTSWGVLLRQGNTGNLTLTNCSFWAVPGTLVEVRAGSLNLNACNIHEWALHAREAPCIVQSGGRLNVNACTFNRGGLLASLSGEGSLAMFQGNMGSDPLVVASGIGRRAMCSTNNPPVRLTRPAPAPPSGRR
ncbi:MAG TPA: glycosyl hydrolase family 28-related protein [Chthonomonadales bacterium]|nr:glycosyl hydrolase family 28-related protein [Chthonomonadales bacterium]